MLRLIFHTGGIVFGGSLRDYHLKVKPDPSSDVDFVINDRVLKFIKADFGNQFIFDRTYLNQDYPLKVRIGSEDYFFEVFNCISKQSGKKIIDFIVLYECPNLQLGEIPFQNMTIRKLLLEKGNYDINRLFGFLVKRYYLY